MPGWLCNAPVQLLPVLPRLETLLAGTAQVKLQVHWCLEAVRRADVAEGFQARTLRCDFCSVSPVTFSRFGWKHEFANSCFVYM